MFTLSGSVLGGCETPNRVRRKNAKDFKDSLFKRTFKISVSDTKNDENLNCMRLFEISLEIVAFS